MDLCSAVKAMQGYEIYIMAKARLSAPFAAVSRQVQYQNPHATKAWVQCVLRRSFDGHSKESLMCDRRMKLPHCNTRSSVKVTFRDEGQYFLTIFDAFCPLKYVASIGKKAYSNNFISHCMYYFRWQTEQQRHSLHNDGKMRIITRRKTWGFRKEYLPVRMHLRCVWRAPRSHLVKLGWLRSASKKIEKVLIHIQIRVHLQ